MWPFYVAVRSANVRFAVHHRKFYKCASQTALVAFRSAKACCTIKAKRSPLTLLITSSLSKAFFRGAKDDQPNGHVLVRDRGRNWLVGLFG